MQKGYQKNLKKPYRLLSFWSIVTQLSKEYDVAPATIYKWIDLYSKSNESSSLKPIF
ncbi:hypothetical protein ICE98_00287 [Lactococcus lactis]|nr:hypothetical protein [Lactococcus lactis]